MFFTLAVSARTPAICGLLAARARIVDPSVMPIPGPAGVVWRSDDGKTALLHWGSTAFDGGPAVSQAGTIWAWVPAPGAGRASVFTRTSVTRVDPVYVTELADAVIVSDRATWAGWTASRLNHHDPLHLCALLNPGFPLGAATPFRGVSALAPSTTLQLLDGEISQVLVPAGPPGRLAIGAGGDAGRASRGSPARRRRTTEPGVVDAGLAGLGLAGPDSSGADLAAGTDADGFWSVPSGAAADTPGDADPGAASRGDAGRAAAGFAGPGPGGPRALAEALVAAVAPLRRADSPVELSLTGGKDSRLVAAALVAAGVPVVARTHGFAGHPDVVVAAEIARRLGIEHIVRMPAAPGHQVDVLGRIRATVLVADGMLSAFENVGRPDPAASRAVTAGGHGGELLRGGYAERAAGLPGAPGGLRAALDPARRAARSAELLRRLTTGHLGLLRRGAARSYVASLASWTPRLARGPLHALDDFYLVNRAGRWSAAARQAYLLREHLVQPLFDDRVVLAARAVPLADRVSGALSAAVLAELSPVLADVPLAGKPPAPSARTPAGAAAASFDWRRQYGDAISSFLRGYVLELGTAGGLFDVASRPAAEKLLTPPHADRAAVWALATLACLVSGDYRHAREPAPHLPVT